MAPKAMKAATRPSALKKVHKPAKSKAMHKNKAHAREVHKKPAQAHTHRIHVRRWTMSLRRTRKRSSKRSSRRSRKGTVRRKMGYRQVGPRQWQIKIKREIEAFRII